jgi:hypothetical protein
MHKFCLISLSFIVCLAPARAQTLEIQTKKQTVLYLQRLQTKEGGFLPAAPDPASKTAVKPSLRATSSAVRALKYFGGELPDKAACVKFVASCFDKASGGFADTPGGQPDVVTTAVGLMAVVELDLPPDPYHAAGFKYLNDHVKSYDDVRIAAAALESIKMMPKGPSKEWAQVALKLELPPKSDEPNGRASLVATKAVTLLRLGAKVPALDIVKELQKAQRSNGGYGKDESLQSDLETTYRVMRALWMLKAPPRSVDDMHNFLHKCRNEDGGYGVAPGDPSSVAGTYYAASITGWLEGKK